MGKGEERREERGIAQHFPPMAAEESPLSSSSSSSSLFKVGAKKRGKREKGGDSKRFFKVREIEASSPLSSFLVPSLPPSGLLWGLIYPFIFLLVGIFSRFMGERTLLCNFFWASNFAAHATQCNARRILNFEHGVWGEKAT